MSKTEKRRPEELLALAVIQTVGGLGDTEWEWVQPGRSPTPDLEVTLGKGRTAGVEITSHVNSDEMAFQKAFESLQGEVAAPELSYRWTLIVERGNTKLKDAMGGIRRLLRNIERTGRSPAEMLAEAERGSILVATLRIGRPISRGSPWMKPAVPPCTCGQSVSSITGGPTI